jgi:hypothetical protein
LLPDILADDNLGRTDVYLILLHDLEEKLQSAQGFDLSVGSVIGMIVALLKQMHLQNETGLYAIYTTC